MKDSPHERSAEALEAPARMRGSGVSLEAAEGFVIVREHFVLSDPGANADSDGHISYRRIRCPSCGSPSYRIDRTKGTFTFGACRCCGLAYMNPLPVLRDPSTNGSFSTVTSRSYYDGLLAAWRSQCEAARKMVGHRIEAYASALGYRPASILEVGCGTGAWGAAYRESGISYKGIDINPAMVDFARINGTDVERADIVEYESPRPADVVFASQVLEHSMRPRGFLSGAARALRNGGLLHLDVPNNRGLIPAAKKLLGSSPEEHGFLQPYHHCIAYDPRSLRRLIGSTLFWPPLWIKAKSNVDRIWGQLSACMPVVARFKRCMIWASGLVAGSLLVLLARKGSKTR